METLFHLDSGASLAEHFATEEALGLAEWHPTARFWRHRKGLVLGLRDARLPDVPAALAHFRSRGYDIHVRSSGGQLVILDSGVLNIAIGFPGEDLPSVDEGFRLMAELLSHALASWGLEVHKGLVPGSICPGSSDLSVGHVKVAGLSQRRRRHFVLVHAFLLVEGVGDTRVRAARTFYRLAGHPSGGPVEEGTMASVSQLVGSRVCVEDVAARLKSLLSGLP